MKKLIALLLCLCSLSAFAQTLIFSNQTITVEPQNLAVESVSYRPLQVVTNQITSWETVTVITTNGMFSGGDVVTNTVDQQVFTPEVATNAASWTCNVIFSLPKGHQWTLNNFPVSIERFRTRLEVPVDPAAVNALFGEAAAGLEFAAMTGNYTPAGQVKAAFLSLAAGVLSGE